MKRAGVTNTFAFLVRNMLRDWPNAFVQSENWLWPQDFLKGFVHTVRKTELYWQSKSMGAQHASMAAQDRNLVTEVLKLFNDERLPERFRHDIETFWANFRGGPRGWVDEVSRQIDRISTPFQRLQEVSDFSTRMAARRAP